MEPGNLTIFNSLLAHGVRPNHADERVRLWRELDHPRRDAFPGDPRGWEKADAATARLTPLGDKLSGWSAGRRGRRAHARDAAVRTPGGP